MPAPTPQTGRVDAVLVGHHPLISLAEKKTSPDGAYLRTARQPTVTVTLEGFEGDRHAGWTMVAVGHTAWLPRGTVVRNTRQVTIVAAEELAVIAAELAVPELRPEWVGANLLLSGVGDLTSLPPGTRLWFPDDTILAVEGVNVPCVFPGKAIAAAHPGARDLGARFVERSTGRRGLAAWVERAGTISEGDAVEVLAPGVRPAGATRRAGQGTSSTSTS